MAVRVVIVGDVQGVGFRWWMAGQASALDLDGFVRN
ncbi:MAG: acylphosphatase, partial [Ancalomicrobiaceae bacterium]|nr:acylphosphatase [Ancalomicrobiaceae bacterium]